MKQTIVDFCLFLPVCMSGIFNKVKVSAKLTLYRREPN